MEKFNGEKMVNDSTVSLLHSLLGESVNKAVEEGKVDITSCLVGDAVTKGAVNLFLAKLSNLVSAHNVAVGMCGMDCNVTLTVENGVVSMHFSNVKEAPKAEPTSEVPPAVKREIKKTKWVREHYEAFKKSDCIVDCQDEGMTAIYVPMGKYGGKVVRSYCSPNDIWSEKTGIAVAYARAKGEQIPDFI